MPIKLRILLCVLALELAGYGVLLTYFVQSTGTALSRLRDVQVRGLFEAQAERIDAQTALLERSALDLATAGEALYRTHARLPALDAEAWVSEFLQAFLTRTRDAVGLGLWYEPERLIAGRHLFGPYAFWDDGAVKLTWDLSSETYDYLNKSWYVQGIPADWPRQQARPLAVYWTEPYFDDAATNELMMTVDAPMYAAGEVIGMATIDWSLQGIRDLIAPMRPTPGSRAFMIDSRSGRFVSFVLDDSLTMQPAGVLEWAKGVSRDARGGEILVRPKIVYRDVDYTVFATSTKVGFVFGVMMPQADIDAEIIAVRRQLLWFGAILSLAFIGLVFLTLRLLFRPFQKLLGAIDESIRIDEGNGAVTLGPLSYEARNEFAPIVRALNQVYAQVDGYTRQLARANDDLRAQQAQISALNASLEQRVQERTEHLVNLAEVGKELTASPDIERTFRHLYRRLHDSIGARVLLIGVHEADAGRLHIEFCMEEGERFPGWSYDLAERNRPAVICVLEQRPLVAWSAQELEALVPNLAPPPAGRLMETVVYFPLRVGERMVGCLSVQSPEPEAFHESQLEFVRILASYTAIALDNAQSYARLKTTLADLQTTQERLLVSERRAAVQSGGGNPHQQALSAAQALQLALADYYALLRQLADAQAEPELLRAFTRQFDELHAHLESIMDRHQRIHDIVRDLRTYARMDIAELKSIAVADLLRPLLKQTGERFPKLTIIAELGINPELECYPQRLQQALSHLLANACQAVEARRGGAGASYSGQVTVRTALYSGRVEILIEDNGCGMSNEVRARIFEPFFTTRPHGAGVGLGLSVALGILTDHRGEIDVESVPDHGSRVTVRLPLQQRQVIA